MLEGGPPPGCDLAKEPKDSAPCVTELVGVFVSPLGDDTADGSRNKPVKTIGKGLELLADRGRVYICEGTYAEAVTLTKTVSLYGGWSCAGGTWAYTGKKPIVRSAAGSVALTLKSAKDVVVADIAFEASDATAKGGSSIAGFAANSSGRLVRDSFTAGAGQAGEDGPATVAAFSPLVSPTGNSGANPLRYPNPQCIMSAGGMVLLQHRRALRVSWASR
ncbi:MAG: hypothetical protein JWM74_63 [Myxococcaceae bacterium]|nr:hypothetical protein [Myxococcaceae bacterium]